MVIWGGESKMNTHPNRTKRTGERAVMVTTSHRGYKQFHRRLHIDTLVIASHQHSEDLPGQLDIVASAGRDLLLYGRR